MLGDGGETDWSLFVYSLLIIVREGLEALLIVAAIVAYLVKNNHQDKLPLIRQSVVVALIASVLTAFIFQWLFANSSQSRELLEVHHDDCGGDAVLHELLVVIEG